MLEFRLGESVIRFTFPFFAIMTLFMLLDKSGLAFYAFLAAILHELGHIIMFMVVGCKIKTLSFEAGGMKIKPATEPFSRWQKALILLAGSATNFLVFLGFWLLCGPSLIGYLHLLLGIFNLLPFSVLDGGGLLKAMLGDNWEKYSVQTIYRMISYLILAFFFLSGIYLAFHGNFTLLLTSFYLLLIFIREKGSLL